MEPPMRQARDRRGLHRVRGIRSSQGCGHLRWHGWHGEGRRRLGDGGQGIREGDWISRRQEPQKWSVENWRHGAYKKLIARCHDSVDEMAGGRGVSGTTITALVFTISHGITPQVDIVNLGDSRCYKMDEEGTSLLTHDHSLTGDMARAGYIEIHEIPDTAGSSALTRNVGDEARSEPDLFTINLTEEAGFILCCDGVWDPLHGPEGLWLPDCNPFSQKAADLIVEEAIKRGSTDNCSVLIFNPGIES